MSKFNIKNILNEVIETPTNDVISEVLIDPNLYSTVFIPNGETHRMANDIYDQLISLEHLFGANPSGQIVSMQAFPIYTEMSDYQEGNLVIRNVARTAFRVYVDKEPIHYFYRVAEFKWSPTYGDDDFRSYVGYTKLQLFLPYYGFYSLKPDDVIGKYINIFLKPNYATGDALYIITTTLDNYSYLNIGHHAWTDNDIYEFDNFTIIDTIQFKMGIDLPIGSTNSTETSRNIIMNSLKFAASIAGYSAPIPTSYSTTENSGSKQRVLTSVNPKNNEVRRRTYVDDTFASKRTTTHDRSEYEISRRVNDIFDSGLNSLRSFNVDSSATNPTSSNLSGCLPLDIELIEYTPKYVNYTPEFNHLYGRPLGRIKSLISMYGYTEISNVHIQGEEFKNATYMELAMLEDALIKGVIFPDPPS